MTILVVDLSGRERRAAAEEAPREGREVPEDQETPCLLFFHRDLARPWVREGLRGQVGLEALVLPSFREEKVDLRRFSCENHHD